MSDADQLREAIERMHGGTATLAQSVPIRETFEGETVWEGAVHDFDLADHPTTPSQQPPTADRNNRPSVFSHRSRPRVPRVVPSENPSSAAGYKKPRPKSWCCDRAQDAFVSSKRRISTHGGAVSISLNACIQLAVSSVEPTPRLRN